jgi:hypothetical protein
MLTLTGSPRDEVTREHWFDAFTRGMASGELSRRRLMKWMAGLALTSGAVLTRTSTRIASAQPPAGQTGCTVQPDGKGFVQTLSVSAEVAGKPVALSQTTRRAGPKGPVSTRRHITFGGKLLLEVAETRSGGTFRTTLNYGPDFWEIKHASFQSTDGKIIRGEVDGRPIQPFRVTDDPRSVKFAQGVTPPAAKASPEVQEALNTVLKKAQEAASHCAVLSSGRLPPGSGPLLAAASTSAIVAPLNGGLRLTGRLPVHRYALAEPGHDSMPITSLDCAKCWAKCIGEATGCIAGAGAGCAGALFFYAVCVAIAEGICALNEYQCLDTCHDPGHDCCPVGCGQVACCEATETCLNSNGVCCSQGFTACGGKQCCKTDAENCISASGICCPKGQKIAGNVCCKKGEDVVGATSKKCCPHELTCGEKTCCGELMKCANPQTGLCCPFAVTLCGNICCKPGEGCIGGKCCPKPCGNVCCGSSQACKDGKCVTAVCSSNQVTCISDEGANKPKGAAICCPPNVACCLGKCCKPGELCCSSTAVPFGCHDPGVCVG